MYSSHAIIFDAWAWKYTTTESWQKNISEWFGSLGDESVRVDFADVQTFGGGDTLACCAKVTYTAVNSAGEKLRSLQNRHSWILEADRGELRIVHEHSSAPIDFTTMKAQLSEPTG